MSKHTPLPWVSERTWTMTGTNKSGEPVYEDRFSIVSHGEVSSTIAMTEGGYADDVESANADMIVRAVNCHADLLEALQNLIADLQDAGDDRNPETGEEYVACKAAREAIAKATGETT